MHATAPTAAIKGEEPLDDQGRRRKAFPVREMRRRSEEYRRHDPVRPRLVDGGAADFRSSGRRPAGFLGDGLVRAPRLRLLVRRHGGLRPLDQGSRQQRPDRARRRRLLCRGEPISRSCAASGRSSFTASRRARCAPLYSRNAIPTLSHGSRSTPWSGPAKARRRWPSARKSFPNSAPRTAGRSTRPSSIRSSTAIIPARRKTRSSTPSPTPSSRSTTRCRPALMSICARKLPVVDPEKIAVPTLIMRGQWDGIAGFEDLVGVLRPAAKPGQAFCRHAGHFTRELPAEELRARLSHPVELLHPAGADLSGLRLASRPSKTVRGTRKPNR